MRTASEPRTTERARGVFGGLLSATAAWLLPASKRAGGSVRLGPYELERKIGEGGMGIVYVARHARHGRRTALKVQKADHGGTDAAARFDREARLTSLLKHPNTVSVRDFGRTSNGVPYYAMELLEGATLEQVVEATGPLAPARVVHVLRGLLSALAEVHAKGFVHRDIKPSNVFLCDGDRDPDAVKLLDFGLVKDLNADAVEDKLLGTPQYLAPESIVAPGEVDARTDLYALGALAYYLLTGAAPFLGRSLVEVCSQHLHVTPVAPSSKMPHGMPIELERLVLACLEKRQSDRPASAVELLQRLNRIEGAVWDGRDASSWWEKHGALVSSRREQESSDALALSETFAAAQPNTAWLGAA
jgi:eukaryotic-like serine/threonine-protein kinase